MSVITKVKDPVTRKELVMAEGIVEFVKLDKYPETKVSYIKVPGQKDKVVESTHKVSLLLKSGDDSQWLGLGDVKLHPQHENLQVKNDDGQWVTIEKGVEISCIVKVNEWQGKTYYQTTKAKINVISTAGVQAQSTSQNKPSNKPSSPKASGTKVYGTISDITEGVATVQDEDKDGNGKGEVKVVLGAKEAEVTVGGRLTANIDDSGNITSGFKAYGPKDDDVGVRVGNAFNVAVDAGLITAKSDIASELPEIVAKLDAAREEAAKANPTLSQRALGGRFGLSVVTASKFAKKGASVDDLIEAAKPIFLALGQVEDEVRNGAGKQKLQASKSVTSGKESQEPQPFPQQQSANVNNEPPMDFDDDIPFASLGLQYASHAIHAIF